MRKSFGDRLTQNGLTLTSMAHGTAAHAYVVAEDKAKAAEELFFYCQDNYLVPNYVKLANTTFTVSKDAYVINPDNDTWVQVEWETASGPRFFYIWSLRDNEVEASKDGGESSDEDTREHFEHYVAGGRR